MGRIDRIVTRGLRVNAGLFLLGDGWIPRITIVPVRGGLETGQSRRGIGAGPGDYHDPATFQS
jgi:hypothetical protein